MSMQRRSFVIHSAASLAAPALVRSQSVENHKLSIAVGGKNLL
jgi:hypothetical protein